MSNTSVWITEHDKPTTLICPDIPKDDKGNVRYEITFADQIIAGLYLKNSKKPLLSQCKKAVKNYAKIDAVSRKYITMQWEYQLKNWKVTAKLTDKEEV